MNASTISPPAADERSLVGVICDLVKARLTALVLLTTLVGFYVGSSAPLNYVLMLNTLIGTALLASGAAALNQLLERHYDARMRRTENRPLPSGRVQPETVLIFGGICSVVGLIWLSLLVNLLSGFLGALTLLSYLFVYTPLKRVTSLNTAVGAIPGALPPLIGWVAAQGQINAAGWSLFAILFFWQLPHFLAIAWLYREEYAKAGFAMLPVFDADGSRTATQALSHTLGLLPISLFPFLFGIVGYSYAFGALALGLVFVGFAIQFARNLTKSHARRLFFVSIIYLPLLLGLMVIAKK